MENFTDNVIFFIRQRSNKTKQKRLYYGQQIENNLHVNSFITESYQNRKDYIIFTANNQNNDKK